MTDKNDLTLLEIFKQEYRESVMWSVDCLEYLKTFDSFEDFDPDGLGGITDEVQMLRSDARDELRRAAHQVAYYKKQIVELEEKQMRKFRRRK